MPESTVANRRSRSSHVLVGLAAGLTMLAAGAGMASCDGGLSHRSVAEMANVVPIGQDIECVRIEVENGTVGVDVGTAGVVNIGGGVRRAADTHEDLVRLEQIPFALQPGSDPERPRTLVLRGPKLPPGLVGLLGLELGVRVPAELALEVVVTGSGHITVGNRKGRTDVATGRGDLRFERCSGPVKGKTGRGTVIAFDHRGDLDIQTMVGDMQAFVVEPGALIRLGTGQGTVQCGVPPDLQFDLDARAETGHVGADFGLTAERVGSYGASLVAKRGAGTTRVVLRTGSGHLYFRAK